MGNVLCRPCIAAASVKAQFYSETMQIGLDRLPLSYVQYICDGSRLENEDRFSVQLSDNGKMGWFGVYDGHKGPDLAILCENELGNRVFSSLTSVENLTPEALKKCFEQEYLAFDRMIMDKQKEGKSYAGGSTCTTVLITEDLITFANIGDSTGVLVRNRNIVYVTPVHHVDLATELERIKKSKFTTAHRMGLLNSSRQLLEVTRAFGDFKFKLDSHLDEKDQPLTAFPDVMVLNRDVEDDFFILATDGLWKSFSPSEVVTFIYESIESGLSLEKCAARLVRKAATKEIISCMELDNVAIVLVKLR